MRLARDIAHDYLVQAEARACAEEDCDREPEREYTELGGPESVCYDDRATEAGVRCVACPNLARRVLDAVPGSCATAWWAASAISIRRCPGARRWWRLPSRRGTPGGRARPCRHWRGAGKDAGPNRSHRP